MALLSMVLLIAGAGGVLLGLGWLLTDGVAYPNIKPALGGLVMISVGLAIPIENGATKSTETPPTTLESPSNSPSELDLQLAVWPTISTRIQTACATNLQGKPSCWGELTDIGKKPVVQIALGRAHGCALRTNGQVTCWGDAQVENTTLRQKRFTAIASTLETTCGLTKSGELDCWGAAMEPPPGGQQYKTISGGAAHFCGLDDAGEATCWGDNQEGQSKPLPGPYIAISAGHFHTCAIQADSTVQCWGRNQEKQSSPPNSRFRQISSGWSHTCGINQRGSIECWGCGDKTAAVAIKPRNACRPPAGQFIAVSSGDLWESCAVGTDGIPICWGGLSYNGGRQ